MAVAAVARPWRVGKRRVVGWGMSPAAVQPRMSAQEYLADERAATEKHQYIAGEVFAMAGASPRHSNIVANLVMLLGQTLVAGHCRVFSSDLKLHIPAFELFTYPDVSIICGEPALYQGSTDVVLNPKVLIEVLSPATEGYDRGEKARAYRSIASLSEYVLVADHMAHVEQYIRQRDDSWRLRVMGADGKLTLDSVLVALDIDAVYRGVLVLPG